MHHSCKGTACPHCECASNPGLHARARSWQTLALFPGFRRWYQCCSSFVMPGMGRSEMGIIMVRHPSLHVYVLVSAIDWPLYPTSSYIQARADKDPVERKRKAKLCRSKRRQSQTTLLSQDKRAKVLPGVSTSFLVFCRYNWLIRLTEEVKLVYSGGQCTVLLVV